VINDQANLSYSDYVCVFTAAELCRAKLLELDHFYKSLDIAQWIVLAFLAMRYWWSLFFLVQALIAPVTLAIQPAVQGSHHSLSIQQVDAPKPHLELTKRDGHSHSHAVVLVYRRRWRRPFRYKPPRPHVSTRRVHVLSVLRRPSDEYEFPLYNTLIFHLISPSRDPTAIAMRSVNSSWQGVLVVIFYSLCALGCAASAIYTKLTPNM
jgi:hypothetical protein